MGHISIPEVTIAIAAAFVYAIPIAFAIWVFVTLRRMEKKLTEVERMLRDRS